MGSLLVQVGHNVFAFLDDLYKKVQVVAYVSDKIKQPEIDSLLQSIKSFKEVSSCIFISKEQALKEVINEPEIKNYMDTVKENPLPNSLRIEVRKGNNKTAVLKELAEAIKVLPGIVEISYKQQETEHLLHIAGAVRAVMIIFLSIALSAVLFSSWSIAWSFACIKKQELHAGKTKQDITRLLMTELLLTGLISGILAGTGLVLIETIASPVLNSLWSGRWCYAGIILPVFTTFLGGLIAYIGSLSSTAKGN